MKSFQRLSMLFILLVLSLTSCEWDNSPEPPHPTYISYNISAWLEDGYTGPELLFEDINTWIKNNSDAYDKKVEYSTGDASEFKTTDAEALTRYTAFKSKFTKYLDTEIKTRLAAGAYESKDVKVNATFYVFAERLQGNDNKLKSEKIVFTYP